MTFILLFSGLPIISTAVKWIYVILRLLVRAYTMNYFITMDLHFTRLNGLG